MYSNIFKSIPAANNDNANYLIEKAYIVTNTNLQLEMILQ